MMQAKLPDVNAALVKHRDKLSHHLEHRNWRLVEMHFNSANALFPEEYGIQVNTESYNDKIQSHKEILCEHCNRWQEYSEIKPYEITLNPYDRLVLQVQKARVWDCLHCKKVLLLSNSKKKLSKPMEPFYTQVIPEPPRKHGLYDRVGYNARMYNWADIAYKELEHQVSKYRTEYAKQNDSEAIPIEDNEDDG